MTNGQVFFYVALGCIFAIGAYALVLAVALDRSLKTIEKLKQEIKNLIPF
jgi:hypothetical protein